MRKRIAYVKIQSLLLFSSLNGAFCHFLAFCANESTDYRARLRKAKNRGSFERDAANACFASVIFESSRSNIENSPLTWSPVRYFLVFCANGSTDFHANCANEPRKWGRTRCSKCVLRIPDLWEISLQHVNFVDCFAWLIGKIDGTWSWKRKNSFRAEKKIDPKRNIVWQVVFEDAKFAELRQGDLSLWMSQNGKTPVTMKLERLAGSAIKKIEQILTDETSFEWLFGLFGALWRKIFLFIFGVFDRDDWIINNK